MATENIYVYIAIAILTDHAPFRYVAYMAQGHQCPLMAAREKLATTFSLHAAGSKGIRRHL